MKTDEKVWLVKFAEKQYAEGVGPLEAAANAYKAWQIELGTDFSPPEVTSGIRTCYDYMDEQKLRRLNTESIDARARKLYEAMIALGWTPPHE